MDYFKIRKYYEKRFYERYQPKHKGISADFPNYFNQHYSTSHAKTIEEHLFSGKLALDLGCGEGNHIDKLLKYFDVVVGIDLSVFALKLAQRKTDYVVQAFAHALPLKEHKFDYVLCSEVIEHIFPGDSKWVIREIYRILKSTGKLLMTTDNGWEYRRLYNLPFKILSLFSRKSLGELKSTCFKIYLKLTGAKSGIEIAIKECRTVEHLNVLSPVKLRTQLLDSKFSIIENGF